MKPTPHIRAEVRFVGHGYQLDIWDFTHATKDGQGIHHTTVCNDFADTGNSICDRARQGHNAIIKAMATVE